MLTVAEVDVVDFLLYTLAPTCQCEEGEESCHNHDCIDKCIAMEGEPLEVESKHSCDKGPSQANVIDAEEHPDDTHGEKGKDNRWNGSDFFHRFVEEKLVGADEKAM